MSLPICSSDWMISGPRGTGFNEAWFPRIVAERFAASTRDGDVAHSPDPLPFITTELSWTNTTGAAQVCHLWTHRAPRVIIAANPNTYALDDALSWDVGESPNAPAPFGVEDGVGARLSVTPFALNTLATARIFRGWDDSVRHSKIGDVAAGETVHVRYECQFTTPGQWRSPQGGQIARAFWVRLQLWAAPGDTP